MPPNKSFKPKNPSQESGALDDKRDPREDLMEEGCVFFPELYRLWDREVEYGITITDAELRNLTELCTFCGICPCPKIPANIMEAKSRYRDKEGLPLAARTSNDVPRIARLCSTFPRLVSALQTSGATGPLLKKIAGVHTLTLTTGCLTNPGRFNLKY